MHAGSGEMRRWLYGVIPDGGILVGGIPLGGVLNGGISVGGINKYY